MAFKGVVKLTKLIEYKCAECGEHADFLLQYWDKNNVRYFEAAKPFPIANDQTYSCKDHIIQNAAKLEVK